MQIVLQLLGAPLEVALRAAFMGEPHQRLPHVVQPLSYSFISLMLLSVLVQGAQLAAGGFASATEAALTASLLLLMVAVVGMARGWLTACLLLATASGVGMVYVAAGWAGFNIGNDAMQAFAAAWTGFAVMMAIGSEQQSAGRDKTAAQ